MRGGPVTCFMARRPVNSLGGGMRISLYYSHDETIVPENAVGIRNSFGG
jgi:hypothetical protein